MKNWMLIGFILMISGCKDVPVQKPEKMLPDSTTIPPLQEMHKDSIIPSAYVEEKVQLTLPEGEDTLEYTKSDFDALKEVILKDDEGFTLSPDNSFSLHESFIYEDSGNQQRTIRFESEAGKDAFYETYAWFLRPGNGVKQYNARRKKIIEIFRTVNQIFHGVRDGGTYYGHQHRRILGYGEYAIYKYKVNKSYYSKNAGLFSQKKVYMNSLRQIITKKINEETGIPKEELSELRRSLMDKLSILDKQISDYFYLHEAREFQSTYYP